MSEVARPEANSASVNRGAPDAFAKAYNFRRADDAIAAGMHPYFKPIASQHGGTVRVNGVQMVITGSNDYLGLTQDPRLKEAARASLDDFGTSCTGSRFLTGTLTLHEELEQRLAEYLGKESVLTFSAGYLGCLSVISALAGRHDILYFDRENHASLYDAARLSYATLRKFEHNDLAELDRLLRMDEGRPGGRIIVTDGVFSMSGHIAKLPKLVEIKNRYGARLIVDDAHSTGVLGA
ncbi:MAG TPA: pyridoxal phosphate-dependent aminotransferase family protein, partial [Trueperaceae bacterium]|nr:pyridoxal phosphate-dependent aminotransferase family protein [Trueperaceae bacterium]